MATLTGKTIADTYKDLLQVSNANSGIDGTLRTVQDGEGTNSALQLSNSTVNINGIFQLNGSTLTATASALNAVTDLSGITGLVAMSGGSPNGRSIAVGTGLSVTNANGTAGNPTIQLDSTPVVSGSYGPVVKFDVNQKGQIVSASTPVSVSIATVRTSELVASILHVTSDVSVNGNVVVSGGLEVISDVSANVVYATSINSDVIDANVINVSVLNYSLVSTTSFTVNNLTVVSKVSGNNATFSGIVSASSFYGDGSNLTNLPTAPVSVSVYTVNILTVVSAATVNGIVSAVNFVGDGANLTNVSAIFAASATNATNAVSAVFATSATNATNAVSATFATSATNATNAVNATSAVFASSATNATNAVNATSATFAASATNATNAVSAAFATSATNATNAVSATFAASAANATNAINATSAVFASSATNATNAVNATNVTGSGIVSAASAVFTGIVSANEIDASIANFNGAVSVGSSLNVVGTISGTNAVFTGSVSVSSAIAVGAGTVGAPSLTTTGDSNTGIYFPAANTLAASTAGSERMRIDSAGNVGIGTTSPAYKLDVNGAIRMPNATVIFMNDSSGVAKQTLQLFSDDNTYMSTPGALILRTNGTTERMRITSTGNVGIGTAGPTRTLDVVGTASFTGVVSVSSVAFGTSNLGKKIAVSGAAIATIVSLTDGTSISVDFNTSQNFAVMLTGNRTLESPSNCVAGQTGSIFVMQNVSGGKTLSFGTNWKFATGTAPTLTTTASAMDRLDYIVFSSTAIHTVATLDVR
jgi:hypothetical protein